MTRISLLVLWLVGICATAVVVCSPLGFAADVATMAAEFRSLRTIRGHFGGGEWRDDVDAWKGRKHEVMVALGERLVGVSTAELTELLGAPDEKLASASMRAQYGTSAVANGTLFCYWWRGRHDFLYFVVRDGRTVASSWYHALE